MGGLHKGGQENCFGARAFVFYFRRGCFTAVFVSFFHGRLPANAGAALKFLLRYAMILLYRMVRNPDACPRRGTASGFRIPCTLCAENGRLQRLRLMSSAGEGARRSPYLPEIDGKGRKDEMGILYLVIPCYNEEAVIEHSVEALTRVLEPLIQAGKIAPQSRILLVDDGSKDATWSKMEFLHQTNPFVCCLKLAHNRGHQNALLAGLMEARSHCDCAVSMDADLQDDIHALEAFVDKFNAGIDIVYGVRRKRDTDSFVKRSTALGFYSLMRLIGVDTVYNHADYRLMSRRALDALAEYKEVNLFLRGIVPMIGYATDYVYYDRGARYAGESKYPLRKMLSFALDGVTSFSVRPLRMISAAGILIGCMSVLGLLYALISKLCGVAVSGWTAIVCSIWLLGGIQLFCTGVVGEYIGKIYSEVKARPRYRVETFLKK